MHPLSRKKLSRSLFSALLVLSLGLASAQAAPAPWKVAQPPLTFSTPTGFSTSPNKVTSASFELFDPSRNMELLVSPGSEGKIPIPRYLKEFPAMLKARGNTVVSSTSLKVDGDPAAFFVIKGLVPEAVESVYVYVTPAKAGAYSLVLNYPAAQRDRAVPLMKELLKGLKLRR